MGLFRYSLLVVVLVGLATSRDLTDVSLRIADLISSHGYPSETHHVTTSDGYILEMFRIPHGRGQTPSTNRPVVFLMHGLYANSHSYIVLGPELAPPYNLADAGFDVWLGNARGNRNSRAHLTLDPDHDEEKFEFFDFTFEEIAMRDLPAMFQYVLEYTGNEKLHYIGHSQGGTVFLVLMSMLPEYNEKVTSAHLLAGVGYQQNFPNTQLSLLALLTDTIYNLGVSLGIVEIFPPSSNDESVGKRIDSCTGRGGDRDYMCELIGIREIMRDDVEDFELGGGSLKQLAHFGQNVRDSAFRRWSFGLIRNMEVYGTLTPPPYDLSLITVNVTMHYTVSDVLLDERDVIAMANDMPNTIVRKVARDSFLHADFVAAPDAKELVTDYIIEALWEAESTPEVEEEEVDVDEENIDVDGVEEIPAPGQSAHNIVLNNVLKMYLIILLFAKLLQR